MMKRSDMQAQRSEPGHSHAAHRCDRWNPEEHAIWLNDKERIASFHAVEGYVRRTPASYEQFAHFLEILLKAGYRFQ